MLNTTHACVFPCNTVSFRDGPKSADFQSTIWVIPGEFSHQALVTLLALQATDSNLSS